MSFITRQGRTLLLTAVLVVGSVCVSNGDRPPALVGQWVSMKNGAKIELFKDGTGVIDNASITWKTEGKRFANTEGNSTFVCDYNLSGYELTRTFDDGEVIVWVRKDKLKEYVEKSPNYFIDSRNDRLYRTVKIGGKTWMAQDLNYQTGKSWCYDDDNSACEIVGRLYDWNTAKTACPAGWHLPSQKEWNDMVAAAGGNVAGKALKSTYGWYSDGNGTDGFGFSALPGGFRDIDGRFYGVGSSGDWWAATENGSSNAYMRNMYYNRDNVEVFQNGYKGLGHSVRCLQD